MRYFLVAYTGKTDDGWSAGNLWFEFEGHPSNEFLDKRAKEFNVKLKKVVFTNIHEFESKEDYEAFSSEELTTNN